jgi:DNA replication protein DnaC
LKGARARARCERLINGDRRSTPAGDRRPRRHCGQARIKAARFAARKTIEEVDFAFQSSLPKNTILHRGQLARQAGAGSCMPTRPRRRALTRQQYWSGL